MQKKKVPVISIIFYVLAAVLLAYSIWAAVFSINYISEAISQNQLMVEGFEFEIASFIMTNAVQYLVYTALLFGAGWIVQDLQPLKSIEFEDEDFDIEDDWLEELEEGLDEDLEEELEEKFEEELEEELDENLLEDSLKEEDVFEE